MRHFLKALFFFCMVISFFLTPKVSFAAVNLGTGYAIGVPGTGTCGLPGETCCTVPQVPIPTSYPIRFGISIAGFNADQKMDELYRNFPVIKQLLDFNELAKDNIKACAQGTPEPSATAANCRCVVPTPAPLAVMKDLCKQIGNGDEQTKCVECQTGVDENGNRVPFGVWTGLGCIKTDFRSFISQTVLGFGVTFGGFAALICIVYGAIQMQLSRGNAERLKKSQELITSCIMGLLLIIFSVFILRLIGVTILQIPGFS